MKHLAVLAFGILAFGYAASNAQQAIRAYETAVVHSAILQKNILLKIALPEDYDRSDKNYPTLYALDGFMSAEQVRKSFEAVASEWPRARAIVICVDIEVKSKDEWFKERSYILTPTRSKFYETFGVKEEWTGGAAQFKDALQREIFPKIKSKFRTDDGSRILIGHSFGGLFGLYVLFTTPEMFSSYILSSPSVPWDDRVIFKYESRLASKGLVLPKRVFMSVGGMENSPEDMMVSHIIELGEQMKLRRYQGLEINTVVLPNMDHDAAPSLAYSAGLRQVFRDQK